MGGPGLRQQTATGRWKNEGQFVRVVVVFFFGGCLCVCNCFSRGRSRCAEEIGLRAGTVREEAAA